MSGSKRRSGYRKSVNESIKTFPEPSDRERLAQVTGMLGSNLFSVRVAKPILKPGIDDSTRCDEGIDIASSTFRDGIALLPTRFKNAVWVRRGGFLIVGDESSDTNVSSSSSSISTVDKVRFRIEHILFPEQIKHLKTRGLWPSEFETIRSGIDLPIKSIDKDDNLKEEEEEDDDDDDDTMRRRRLHYPIPRNRPGDLPISDYDNIENEDDEEIVNNQDGNDVESIIEGVKEKGIIFIDGEKEKVTSSDLILKQLSVFELDNAYAILVECGIWLDTTYGLKHWSPPYAKEVMMRHAKEHFVFGVYLIEEKSMIATFTVGTSCWIPYFNEISNDTWKDQLGVPLYLGKLAVKPSEQKKGIGKALMNKVDEIAKEKGCTSIRFDAIEKVPGLRYFYENCCGYSVVGQIEAKDAKGTMNKLLLFEKCVN